MSGRPAPSKPVIGLVGGIGAGKSAAAREFVAVGLSLVDADRIGHELLADRDVSRRIVQRWGNGVLRSDGQVDRGVLGERVFADPDELKALNELLHPRMRRRMVEQIARAMADPAAAGVVLDAAVLFEAGWDDLCTHVVFVAAPEDVRFERVLAQRNWTRQLWRRREKSQISLDKKAAKCDYTIDNRTSASHLRKQIRELLHRIGLAGS